MILLSNANIVTKPCQFFSLLYIKILLEYYERNNHNSRKD